MGNSMGLCSDCMGGGGGRRGNSPYSYEVFRKMPFFGSISNYLRFFKGGGGSSSMLSNITSIFGGGGGGPFGGFGPSQGGGYPSSGPFPSGPGGQFQGPGFPNASNIFQMLNIRNLLPVGEGGATDSVFDLAKDDTFVRKIKKSNYKEIVAKLKGTNEKFTDPDFPPN